jgi:hypothetical protein
VTTRIERERHQDLEDLVDRIARGDDGAAASRLVRTTTITTYPTTAGRYYGCNPVEIDGTETEGGAATYTADTNQVIYCLNVGTTIPPAGTNLIASAVGGRWTFRYDA